jgi:hypothetical protein
MSESDEARARGDEAKGVTEDDILGDLQSRYAGVRCPVHGVAPTFEMDEKGGVIEGFCCEVLGQIFGELRAGEAAHH